MSSMKIENNFGIMLVTRNNPQMVKEWYSLYNYKGYEIVNIDESTDEKSAELIKKNCLSCGIKYLSVDKGKSGLSNNIIQADKYFKTKRIDWILYMHHDAYPLGESALDKLSKYIQKPDLLNFGVVGFNVLHGETDLSYWNEDQTPLRTCARCPLELGDGWYRETVSSRINYNNSIKKAFAVESVMWSTALINTSVFKKHIEIDDRFVFFHAWDDIAFQFLYKNIYNIVIPDIHFGHDQRLKLKYELPRSSPQADKKTVKNLYGRMDHLDVWKDKWGFKYDINKSKRFGINLSSTTTWFMRIVRYFFKNSISSLPTVARDDYFLIKNKYKNTLIDQFYHHDPKKGPLRYFDI